jgi:hypothetical protein
MELVEIAKRQKDGDSFDPKSAAIGAGGLAGALSVGTPVPRSPMTNRGRGVKRRLERRARIPGGRMSLKTSDFAEVSGGRGYRPQNNAYTAKLAQSMRSGAVKQNRLVLDVYDNNVVQRDGAHRAHAAAMLGRKVKVQVKRHKGEKAPRHATAINAIRDEFVQGRQRDRLKTLGRTNGMSRHQLDQLAATHKGGRVMGSTTSLMSRASGKGVPAVTPKKLAIVGASAGGGALLGSAMIPRRKRS